MMSRLKLQAAASVKPVREMSCTRAEQREAACDAQAEGESGGRDDDRAEAAGSGERQARQGNELKRAEQREAACAAQAEARAAAEMMIRLKLQAAASVPPVGAMSCTRAKQREAACAAQAEGESSGRDDERTEAAVGTGRHPCEGNEL